MAFDPSNPTAPYQKLRQVSQERVQSKIKAGTTPTNAVKEVYQELLNDTEMRDKLAPVIPDFTSVPVMKYFTEINI